MSLMAYAMLVSFSAGSPSGEYTLAVPSRSNFAPLGVRHLRVALSGTRSTVVKQALRAPSPLIRRCRTRTLANVLCAGFIVRGCIEYPNRKSWSVRISSFGDALNRTIVTPPG